MEETPDCDVKMDVTRLWHTGASQFEWDWVEEKIHHPDGGGGGASQFLLGRVLLCSLTNLPHFFAKTTLTDVLIVEALPQPPLPSAYRQMTIVHSWPSSNSLLEYFLCKTYMILISVGYIKMKDILNGLWCHYLSCDGSAMIWFVLVREKA